MLNPLFPRETTNLRFWNEMAITLGTGDLTWPGRARVNIFTNPGWIKENIKKEVEKTSKHTPTRVKAIGVTTSTNTALADAATTVASAAGVTASGSTAAAAVSGSALATGSAVTGGSNGSAAGRMIIGGGWLSAVAGLMAVMVVQ